MNFKNAKCKMCEQFIQTSGNTINLWYHLQQKYPDIYAIEMITSDTSDSSNVSQKWKKNGNISKVL